MRMRVVEADHIETAESGSPPGVDVALGIELEPVEVAGDVGDADGLENFLSFSYQHAAALSGQGGLGVKSDHVERRSCDSDGYDASTSIAMPMPPPIHSEATP